MGKDDIQKLLNRKIEEAISDSSNPPDGYYNRVAHESYYAGVVRGLTSAKEIIGMLTCKNNHL